MGALDGVTIVEIAAIGPVPFCGMLLSDMGATVIRIDRTESSDLGLQFDARFHIANRGRKSIAVNLKSKEGVETVLALLERADAVIEGFRPGVMERLGLGPDVCLARNKKLVYGRMTGWGQSGPLANVAGHDINYIALTGVLHSVGERGRAPGVPLNLIGDYGGGALYLCVGMLAGLLEAHRSGQGQVVDAAMVDGSASLMTLFTGMVAAGVWNEERGTNAIDAGSHFYNVYETADGEFVSIGCIERKFYLQFLDLIGLSNDKDLVAHQMDKERWPEFVERIAKVMRGKTLAQWCAILQNTDVCFAPVLRPSEVPNHPHVVARETFVNHAGVVQPAPAPRFSRTASAIQGPPVDIGQHTDEILRGLGLSADRIASLRKEGTVA
ncbi:MAG: CaiB/BaiF CoA-transferase family protein [Rhodospirillales bacterium]